MSEDKKVFTCEVTGKRTYSRRTARIALIGAIGQKVGPKRMYKCDHCGWYHLTSKLYR